jgi:hypothetical protein
MIKKANPGLARRFQMADAFEFQDYNDEDLLVILKKRLDQEHILHALDTLRAGVQIVAQERMKPNFGNAGAVNNMLSRAIQNMELRLSNLSVQDRAREALVSSDFMTAEQQQALQLETFSPFGCGTHRL